MTDDLIQRAQDALEGVTAEPWDDTRAGENAVVRGPDDFPVAYYVSPSNRRFIAAARQLVPDLLARIAAQEAEIARLTAAERTAWERGREHDAD